MALVFFRVNTLIMIIIKKTEVKLISKKFYLGIRISRSALINSCGTAPSPSNKKVEKQSTCYASSDDENQFFKCGIWNKCVVFS